MRFRSSDNINSDHLDNSVLGSYHNINSIVKNSYNSINDRKIFHSPTPFESEIAIRSQNLRNQELYVNSSPK